MGTLTTIREFYKPDVGETGWGLLVNAIFDEIDGDIDFEGKVKIWASGGISFGNTSGDHSDPGDNVIRVDQTLNVLNYLDVSDLAEFYGQTFMFGTLFIPKYTSDVSNPPTEAEIEAIAGAPDLGLIAAIWDDIDGFMWLCISGPTSWWYESLTEAI